jgi:hypothetical protein
MAPIMTILMTIPVVTPHRQKVAGRGGGDGFREVKEK